LKIEKTAINDKLLIYQFCLLFSQQRFRPDFARLV